MFFRPIYLLCILTSTCLANINIYYSWNKLSTFVPALLYRAKRQTDDTSCVQSCMLQLKESVKQTMSNAVVSDNSFSLTLKPEDVGEFCPKVYIPFHFCMTKCPNDETKFYIVAAFDTMKYICIDNYRGARQYFACPYNLADNVTEICEKPCESVDSKANFDTRYDNNITLVWMAKCSQLQCSYQCELGLVKAYCGVHSVAFVNGLTKSGLTTGEKLLSRISGKPFPKECKEFMSTLFQIQ